MREASQQATDTVQRRYDSGAATDDAAAGGAGGLSGGVAGAAADPVADPVGDLCVWMTDVEPAPELASASVWLQPGRPVDGHGTDTKQQKGRRASEFTKWLLEVYGAETLNAGTGVLDVAGGKGAVSYELHCRHNVRCTLIDPGIRDRLLTPRQVI